MNTPNHSRFRQPYHVNWDFEVSGLLAEMDQLVKSIRNPEPEPPANAPIDLPSLFPFNFFRKVHNER